MAGASHVRSLSDPSLQTSRPRVLHSDDVKQGNILWLAPYGETVASFQKRSQQNKEPVFNLTKQTAPEQGFYNHPILVISRPASLSNTIRFLLLTSFDGKDVTKRFRKRRDVHERANFLAFSPAPDHPLFVDGDVRYRTLHLKDGAPMNRPGYVQISQVYEMDWRDAQPYWRAPARVHRNTRLDRQSMEAVLSETARIARYKPKEQYSPRRTTSQGQIRSAPTTLQDLTPYPLWEGAVPGTFIDPLAAGSVRESAAAAGRRPDYLSYQGGQKIQGLKSDPLLPTYYGSITPRGTVASRGSYESLWDFLKMTLFGVMRCVLCCLSC